MCGERERKGEIDRGRSGKNVRVFRVKRERFVSNTLGKFLDLVTTLGRSMEVGKSC